MPGHALLGSQYTATSMSSMIALAGIIVRNSILWVDFHQPASKGWPPGFGCAAAPRATVFHVKQFE